MRAACFVIVVIGLGCGSSSTGGSGGGLATGGGSGGSGGGGSVDAGIPFEVEPNNGATATQLDTITVPGAKQGAIGTANDLDIYALALTAGQRLRWTLDSSGSSLAPYLSPPTSSSLETRATSPRPPRRTSAARSTPTCSPPSPRPSRQRLSSCPAPPRALRVALRERRLPLQPHRLDCRHAAHALQHVDQPVVRHQRRPLGQQHQLEAHRHAHGRRLARRL